MLSISRPQFQIRCIDRVVILSSGLTFIMSCQHALTWYQIPYCIIACTIKRHIRKRAQGRGREPHVLRLLRSAKKRGAFCASFCHSSFCSLMLNVPNEPRTSFPLCGSGISSTFIQCSSETGKTKSSRIKSPLHILSPKRIISYSLFCVNDSSAPRSALFLFYISRPYPATLVCYRSCA